jgi:hypothetical protein
MNKLRGNQGTGESQKKSKRKLRKRHRRGPGTYTDALGKCLVTYRNVYFLGERGGTVVKVLCYKSEGCWFDPRWCHWNFSLT